MNQQKFFETVATEEARQAIKAPLPLPLLTVRAMILVQALSGRGKTTWAVTGGRPLVLAFESKTQIVAPRLNPDAKVLAMNTRSDFERIISAINNPSLASKGYDRIVVDSYSELTEKTTDYYGMSYPLQIQDYGTIGNKALALIYALQKCTLPSIIICRSESRDQGKINRIVPSALGKSAANLPARCVCTAETRFDERQGWVVDTTPDDYTQRSGLPWVPGIFQGTADEFISIVERGPVSVPSSPSTE